MDVPVTLWVAAHATCLPADEFFVLRSVDAARSGAVRSDADAVVIMVSTRIYNNARSQCQSTRTGRKVVCTHHSSSGRLISLVMTIVQLRQPGVDDPDEELEEAVDGVSVGPEAFHLANDLPAVKAARLVEVRLDQRPLHAVRKPRKHPQ